jgi:Tfp pilus assembly protein PilF
LNNFGVLLVRRGSYPKAEEQFKTGIRVAPDYDQSYLNLARLYAIESDRERAKEVLLQLLQSQPQNQNARKALETLE